MKKMKKVLAVALSLVMAGSLAACGSSSTETKAPETGASETAAESTAESGSEAASEVSTDGKVYNIGICQLIQHDALDAATKGFEDAITEKMGDSVKFDEQNAQGDSNTCSTIINSFVSEGADLILANATASLQAAAAGTSDIPILGTAVTEYGVALGIDDFDGTVGGNISGTSDLAPLDEQADMLHELFPDAKNVGLLYCSAEPNSVYQSDVVKQYLENAGLTVNVYTFADSNDVSTVTATACAECDALYIPTDNTAASCTEAINNVAEPAGIPIVTGEEGLCKGCGIATLSISYYDLGVTTGKMAAKILTGEADISEMPIEYFQNPVKKYAAERCAALGIEIPSDYVAIEG
mgnify:CR=1 FL=1